MQQLPLNWVQRRSPDRPHTPRQISWPSSGPASPPHPSLKHPLPLPASDTSFHPLLPPPPHSRSSKCVRLLRNSQTNSSSTTAACRAG